MRRRKLYWASALLCLAGCGKKYADQPPRSPEEALRSIHVSPDFKVDLFASEPMVYDPVEMVFDENGRLIIEPLGGVPERLLKQADGSFAMRSAPRGKITFLVEEGHATSMKMDGCRVVIVARMV